MTTRTAVYSLTGSLSAFALTLLEGPWMPRFSFDTLNYWFVAAAALAVPLSVLYLGLSLTRFRHRVLVCVLAGLVALPLLPYSLLAMLESASAQGGEHPSLELLSEASSGNSRYRLYRTDCGATCSYGLELRREIDLLGFFKIVSPLWSAYREESATLRLTPDGRVQVVRGAYVMFTAGDDA